MMNCWRAEPHRRPTFERILKVLKKNPCGGIHQPQSPSPARPYPLNLPTRRKSLPRPKFTHIGLPALEDPSSSDGDVETGHSTSSSHPPRNTSSSSLERVRPSHRKVSRTPTRRRSRSPFDHLSKLRETPSRSPAGGKKERIRRTPSRSPIVRKRRDESSRPGVPLRSPAHQRGDSRKNPSRACVDMKESPYHLDGTPLGNAGCLDICPAAGSNRKAHARHGSAPECTTRKEYPIVLEGFHSRSASTPGENRYSLEVNGGGVKAIPKPRLHSTTTTTWAPIPIVVVAPTSQLLPALSKTEGDIAAGYSPWNWKKSLDTSAEEIGSPVKSTSTTPPSDPQVPDNEERTSGIGPLVVNGVFDTTPSTESKKTPCRQRRDISPYYPTTPSRPVMSVTSSVISVESTESESVVENRGLGTPVPPHDASLQPQLLPLKGPDALAAWLSGTSKNSNSDHRRTSHWRGEIVELPPSVEHAVEPYPTTNDQKGSSRERKVKKRTPSVEFVHGFRPIDTSDR